MSPFPIMEPTGFFIRGRGTGFSRFSSGIGFEHRKSGPSKFHKSLAERSFLRRLYTGQRSVEVSLWYFSWIKEEEEIIWVYYVYVLWFQNCAIPNTRTTFLIVFSPDGYVSVFVHRQLIRYSFQMIKKRFVYCRTKFASTNGNHNVYIVSVTTKVILKTLSGHRRTPWTLAFHPSNNNVLASGCLDGEVRVWNLEDVSISSKSPK